MIIKSRQCPLNIRSDPATRCVSVCLITLLVFATVTIMTIIQYNPIILLNIAEIHSGQRDFVLRPKAKYLNSTKITEITKLKAMPRILASLRVDGKAATGWLVDFNLEHSEHLGTLGGKEQPNHQHIYLHKSLGYIENQTVEVSLTSNDLLDTLLELVKNKTIIFDDEDALLEQVRAFNLSSQNLCGIFTVKEVYDSPKGKAGSQSIGNSIFLDLNYAVHQMINWTLSKMLEKPGNSSIIRLFNSVRLADLATEITINIPDRTKIYNNPNTQEIQSYISRFGQLILDRLGFFSVSLQMPIASQLSMLQYFGMFIGVMLKSIIVSLFILSTLMLYNMILLDIQKQRYELSILKLLGASKSYVVFTILQSSLKQVIIANLMAYPLIFIGFTVIQSILQTTIGYQFDVQLTTQSCISGVIIGVMVPIIASIMPIRNILANDLAENLSPNQQNYSEVKAEIYVEGQEFPYGKFTFGVLSTTYGLGIYYFLPYAMINQNLGLLMTIFFIFLEGLLIGLVILSYSLEFVFEKMLAKVVLFWVNTTDFKLTLKNLSSHRMQNRQTSILYALSISFIVMISVGFQLQIDATKDEYLMSMGGDIDMGGDSVNPAFINSFLHTLPGLDSVTFVSNHLTQYSSQHGAKNVLISDRAKLFFLQHDIYGVAGYFIPRSQKNGQEVIYTDSSEPYNIYTYLNTEEGQNTCIMSEYAASKLGILHSSNHQFLVNIYYENAVKRIPLNYSSIVKKRKGLYYSSFFFPNSDIAVSMQTYRRLANINSYQQIPINRVKMFAQNKKYLEQITNIIKQKLAQNTEFKQSVDFVWNRLSTDETFENIKDLLNVIMTSLLILVLILCMFSLITNTHINTQRQEKQIGVLLILGYEKERIYKIYIYQSFVLIINSCVKGFASGYIVALMMAWQRELFSSATVHLSFNFLFILVIFIIAVLSSYLSTYRALRHILNKKISEMLNKSN